MGSVLVKVGAELEIIVTAIVLVLVAVPQILVAANVIVIVPEAEELKV